MPEIAEKGGMDGPEPLFWMERVAARLPFPYPVFGALVAAIAGGIFYFFSTRVAFFPWEFFHQVNVVCIAAVLFVEITGIIWLLRQIDLLFATFIPAILREDKDRTLVCQGWKRRFSSPWFYGMAALVILPFFLSFSGFGYHNREPAIVWSGLLDISLLITELFSLYLLAVILWIMLSFVWVLQELDSPPLADLVILDIFSPDGIGGLKPLQDLTIHIQALYFVSIALAIGSSAGPFAFFSWDSLCLIALMVLGMCVFLFMITRIRSLVRRRIGTEIDKIDREYEKQQEKLIGIAAADECEEKTGMLGGIKSSLDALHTQRKRMLGIYHACTGYDTVSILKFSGGFLLSVIAYLQNILDFGKSLMLK